MTAPTLTRVNYRSTVAAADVSIGYQGRAVRFDGSPYATTSQAATDALNPIATGGLLIAENEAGFALGIVGIHSAGEVVTCKAGTGGVAVGDLCRPEYSATAANADRLLSLAQSGLPGAPGTYYTWGVALTAAAAGGDFLLAIERNIHVVA